MKKKIDYSKFKCQVYAPDGTYLGEARLNNSNIFYCPGLVPGQKYDLVFSYDGILLLIISFQSKETGKVVYLSPGHIYFNRDVDSPSETLIALIKDKIIKRDEFKVPFQSWERKTLQAFYESMPGNQVNQSMKMHHPRFKAGAELAKSVK